MSTLFKVKIVDLNFQGLWNLALHPMPLNRLVSIQHDDLQLTLAKIYLSENLCDGFKWWKGNSDYSISNSYLIHSDLDNPGLCCSDQTLQDLNTIWKTNIPSNVQTFCWRLLLNRLPTKIQLEKRGVISGGYNIVCPLCFFEDKDVNHLFLSCPINAKLGLNA